MNIKELAKQFGADEDIEIGGGLASAFAGYMAAELLMLVTRLSAGRNLGFTDEDYSRMNWEARELAANLLAGAFEDIRAFGVIDAAYKLPKSTDEEKKTRLQAIQAGAVYAADVPLNNAANCQKVLVMAQELGGKSNPNCSSDLQCALALAREGIKGCVLHIEANLPIIKSETEKARFTAFITTMKENNTIY